MVRWIVGRQTSAGQVRHLEHFAAAGRVRRAFHAVRGVYSLLLLASVAEPNPDHFLLHAEVVREVGDLFTGRFAIHEEGLFEGHPDGGFDRGALLAPAANHLRRGRRAGNGAGTEDSAEMNRGGKVFL